MRVCVAGMGRYSSTKIQATITQPFPTLMANVFRIYENELSEYHGRCQIDLICHVSKKKSMPALSMLSPYSFV